MEQQRLKPEPEFFSGSAIAALVGLLFGLMLHVAWQKNPGGPQIVSAAKAASAARAPSADDPPANPPGGVELADQDSGPVAPAPLPVTRLAPQMFEVQPAAAGEAEREDAVGLAADDAPQPASRDFD
jgi:hypothetical protein